MSVRSLKKTNSASSIKDQDNPGEDSTVIRQPEEESQPQSLDQLQEQTKHYFSRVERKLKGGLELSQKAIRKKYKELKDEIRQGKYEIKDREWPSSDDNIKNSRSKLTNQSVHQRKNLENQLQMVESRLNEENKEKVNRMMSEEEHQDFIKKVEQQKKELDQRRLEAAKLEEQHRIDEQKRQKNQAIRIDQEKKNKKKQELIDKLKFIEEQKKKKAELFQQQEQALKQMATEKTMAQKMENKYNYRQNEFLQQKKKRLAEIRTLHKPIDKNELDAFSKKLDQLHQEKQEARKEVPKRLHQSTGVFYKSAFYKKAQNEQKSFLDSRHDEELHKLKDARDKLKRYSEHVKNDFVPTLDDKKAEEMKFRGQNGKHRSSSVHNLPQNPRKLGLRYLQYSKINHKLLSSDPQMDTEEDEEDKPKKVDYLAQLREMNKKHPMTAQSLIQKLGRKQMPKEEKAKQILDFTQRIEQKARRRQEVQKIGGGASEELDTLYLQAIEAKLSLLDLDHQ